MLYRILMPLLLGLAIQTSAEPVRMGESVNCQDVKIKKAYLEPDANCTKSGKCSVEVSMGGITRRMLYRKAIHKSSMLSEIDSKCGIVDLASEEREVKLPSQCTVRLEFNTHLDRSKRTICQCYEANCSTLSEPIYSGQPPASAPETRK